MPQGAGWRAGRVSHAIPSTPKRSLSLTLSLPRNFARYRTTASFASSEDRMNAQAETLPVIAAPAPEQALEVFSNKANFELAQRMATALSQSSLVPEAYRGNIPNCLIVLEMANRI